MGIKAYIKDFQKSDAPQFKGHSKEKRRDQAIAAYLDAKDLSGKFSKESVEEARGVPRTQAKTYSNLNLKKARELMSPAKHRQDGIDRIAKGMNISKAKATKHHDDVMKSYGFKPESTKRVTQVSLDQAKRDLQLKTIQKKMKSLDEISVSLRNKYHDAAKKSHDTAANSAFAASLRKEPYDKEMDTMRKRKKGIETAKDQAIKNIRGELYGKKKTTEGAFWGQDKMVKAYKDDDKKRGMVRVRKQDGNMTHTVTVKRNSTDHKKYEKKGYKMDPYFNEMTMGQGMMVKKVPAGDPAPKGGFKPIKLARIHGGKYDVYHKETDKVKDAKAGRTMYNDTTTKESSRMNKKTDEGYIKSDKIHPHPQANLTKVQRRAIAAQDKRKPKAVTLPGMDLLKKDDKPKMKPGRGSEIVKYGRTSSNESKVNEVSKGTLGRYITGTIPKLASAGSLMTGDYGIGPEEKKAKRMKGVKDYSRFDRGIKRAVNKMIPGKAKVPATNEERDRGEFSGDISFMGHDKLKHHYKTGERNKVFSKRQINREFERRSDAASRRKAIFGKDTTPSGKPGPSYESMTWYMPTSKEVTILRNMMKRPIALGENAENAIDNIPIGSDTLHKIFVAEAKKDPNTDARTMVERWLNDRLKHGDEEAEYLGIRLGLLEGYEADVSKFMNKHDIDHHWSGGKLHVDQKDEKRAMKKLSKKYGGYGPRGAKMMPQVHVKK